MKKIRRITSLILITALSVILACSLQPVHAVATESSESSYEEEMILELIAWAENSQTTQTFGINSADSAIIRNKIKMIARAQYEKQKTEEQGSSQKDQQKTSDGEKDQQKSTGSEKDKKAKTAGKEKETVKRAEGEKKKAGENTYTIPIGSAEKHKSADEALDGFLSAMQKADRNKIERYYEQEGIEGAESGAVQMLFGKLDGFLKEEGVSKETEKTMMNIAAIAFDYDYEILSIREENGVSCVDVRFKTYDFAANASAIKFSVAASAAIVYLMEPGIDNKNLVIKLLPAVEKSLKNLGGKTAQSTVTIHCENEGDVWVSDDAEILVKAATGNLSKVVNDMTQEFGIDSIKF